MDDNIPSRKFIVSAPAPRDWLMISTGARIDLTNASRGLALTRISGLQDLKDFARNSGVEVVYSETPRDGNGRGFVEFESAGDLKMAVERLDGREFKNQSVSCAADTQAEMAPRHHYERTRSRSPGTSSRRPYPSNYEDYRRVASRPYSPRHDDGYHSQYRERSPPRREYYDDRRGGGGYRSPRAARPPPMDDYPPPSRGPRYDDPYRRDHPPPPDPYMNGRAYDHRPPPHRDFPPPPERAGYRDGGSYGMSRYDDRSYRW